MPSASVQMKGATCICRPIEVVAHTHDGYRHVQIILYVDISSIMKILNKFQGKGPWVFLRVEIVLI